MPKARLIINVSDQPLQHQNGISGTFYIQPRKELEEFSLLVIYPTTETQDIGDNKKTIEPLDITALARSIVGHEADSGGNARFGVILCEAQPEIPEDLLTAIEAEKKFLNANPPDVKYRRDIVLGAVCAA